MSAADDKSGRAPAPAEAGLAALEWAASSGRTPDVLQALRARQRRRLRRRLAATAAVATFLLAALAWRVAAPVEARAEATPRPVIVSAPIRQALPDGSLVELRDSAQIRVDFGSAERSVVLETGEAHFQVVKDPTRPFVVRASGVQVRAVGTAFAVQLAPAAVDVLVTEGRVAVAVDSAAAREATPAPLRTTIHVDVGRRLTVPLAPVGGAPEPAAIPVTTVEQQALLGWRVPRLEFTGTPLREAIPMFNRHARSQLVLDPALGDLQVSGLLRADDAESLLLLLQNEFRIEAEWRPDGQVLLRRR